MVAAVVCGNCRFYLELTEGGPVHFLAPSEEACAEWVEVLSRSHQIRGTTLLLKKDDVPALSEDFRSGTSGWLHKLSGVTWKRRFFIMVKSACQLLYFESDQNTESDDIRGMIQCEDISCVSIAANAGKQKSGVKFQIELKSGRVVSLMAPSHSECQRWVAMLSRVSVRANTLPRESLAETRQRLGHVVLGRNRLQDTDDGLELNPLSDEQDEEEDPDSGSGMASRRRRRDSGEMSSSSAYRRGSSDEGSPSRIHSGDNSQNQSTTNLSLSISKDNQQQQHLFTPASSTRSIPDEPVSVVTDQITKCGFLKKKARSNRHIWSKRYFVLDTEKRKLDYYRSLKDYQTKPDTTKARTLDLSQVTSVRVPIKGKGCEEGCRFDVHFENGAKLCLQAETYTECQKWVAILSECCGNVIPAHHNTAVNTAVEDLIVTDGEEERELQGNPAAGVVDVSRSGSIQQGPVTLTEEAMLKKRTLGATGYRWKERFFVLNLTTGKLITYMAKKDQARGVPSATYSCDSFQRVQVVTKVERPRHAGRRFNIEMKEGVLELMASDPDECRHWSQLLTRFAPTVMDAVDETSAVDRVAGLRDVQGGEETTRAVPKIQLNFSLCLSFQQAASVYPENYFAVCFIEKERKDASSSLLRNMNSDVTEDEDPRDLTPSNTGSPALRASPGPPLPVLPNQPPLLPTPTASQAGLRVQSFDPASPLKKDSPANLQESFEALLRQASFTSTHLLASSNQIPQGELRTAQRHLQTAIEAIVLAQSVALPELPQKIAPRKSSEKKLGQTPLATPVKDKEKKRTLPSEPINRLQKVEPHKGRKRRGTGDLFDLQMGYTYYEPTPQGFYRQWIESGRTNAVKVWPPQGASDSIPNRCDVLALGKTAPAPGPDTKLFTLLISLDLDVTQFQSLWGEGPLPEVHSTDWDDWFSRSSSPPKPNNRGFNPQVRFGLYSADPRNKDKDRYNDRFQNLLIGDRASPEVGAFCVSLSELISLAKHPISTPPATRTLSRSFNMFGNRYQRSLASLAVTLQQVRQIKVDPSGAVCHQSYIMKNRISSLDRRAPDALAELVNSDSVIWHEQLVEAPCTMQLPARALESLIVYKCRIRDLAAKDLNDCQTSLMDTHISDQHKSLVRAGMVLHPQVELSHRIEQLTKKVESLNSRISDLVSLHQAYSLISTNSARYKGLTFKPSMLKKDSAMRYVCTNLHVQTIAIITSQAGKIRDNKYDLITCGAWTAHSLGFKQGGIRTMLATLEKLCQDYTTFAAEKKGKTRGNVHELTIEYKEHSDWIARVTALEDAICERAEIVFTQALSAAITSVCTTLGRHGSNTAMLIRTAEVGFLVQAQSLLSTIRGEEGMLSDMDWAAEQLNRVKFAIQPLCRCGDLLSPSIARAMSEPVKLSEAPSTQQEAKIHVFLTTEAAYFYETLIPKAHSGRAKAASAYLFANASPQAPAPTEGAGTDYLTVVLGLPDVLYSRLPADLKNASIPKTESFICVSCGFPSPHLQSENEVEQSESSSSEEHSAEESGAEVDSLSVSSSAAAASVGTLPPLLRQQSTSTSSKSSNNHSINNNNNNNNGSPLLRASPKKESPLAKMAISRARSVGSASKLSSNSAQRSGLPGALNLISIDDSLGSLNQTRRREGKIGPDQGLISLTVVFFTQGVNEMQTIANTIRRTDIQTAINTRNVKILKEYARVVVTYTGSSEVKQLFSQNELLKLPTVITTIDELEKRVTSNAVERDKDIRILRLAGDVCRFLSGGTVVCCKSAKDRTSMAVTHDQGRLVIHELLSLLPGGTSKDRDRGSSVSVQAKGYLEPILDVMRQEGVRRMNVVRNTGKPSYAFNALQRSLLPPILCPPVTACLAGNVS